ncbi:MAG: metal ABC transporter substrate-binding protein [Patescibacteria group bacterium]
MKKSSISLFVGGAVLIVAAMIVVFVVLNNPPAAHPSSDKLRIAATIHPLANIISQVGGSYVDVQTILPPGASPHTFEPTPEQIRNLQGTKLIFSIGHGLDNWVKLLADNVPNATSVVMDQGIKLRDLPADQIDPDIPNENVDPHYWLDVSNAKIMSQDIASYLAQKDPTHQTEYANNLSAYLGQLDKLNAEIKNQLRDLSHKELITHHNAWGYFADAYGLKIVGTFEISPGKEPTPQQIADLQTKVKTYNVQMIFSEPQLSEQSLIPFVQDLKLKIAVLDPEGGLKNMGYIDLMRYNTGVIADALK